MVQQRIYGGVIGDNTSVEEIAKSIKKRLGSDFTPKIIISTSKPITKKIGKEMNTTSCHAGPDGIKKQIPTGAKSVVILATREELLKAFPEQTELKSSEILDFLYLK